MRPCSWTSTPAPTWARWPRSREAEQSSGACDERVLEQLLAAGVRLRYLGVVASRRKRAQIYASLCDRFGAQLDLDWIHLPVGLHLSGNTPAQQALVDAGGRV